MKKLFTMQNFFLLAIIIVLPVCISYYSINNLIEEQYLTTRESLVNKLKLQIAKIEFSSITENYIQKLGQEKNLSQQNSIASYSFPIIAINISNNTLVSIDSALSKDKSKEEIENFTSELISTYNSRITEMFKFKNYIVGTTSTHEESEIRLLAMADITDAINKKQQSLLLLKIVSALIIILFISLKMIKFNDLSLRHRIAAVFMTAIIIPLISLIFVGKMFIAHEENRLKESAYTRMRESMEALNRRYKDSPRLIERELYEDLKNIVAKPYTLESIVLGMQKAVKEEIINKYVVFNQGSMVASSWADTDSSLNNILSLSLAKINEEQKIDINSSNKNLNLRSDLENSFHLRHILADNHHIYFMPINFDESDKNYQVYAYLPDKLFEKNFAEREFASNKVATQETEGSLIIQELSFYSTSQNSESYPSVTPVWEKLKYILKRSNSLKVEETGVVKVDNEEFLYLIKPISSMNTKSYLPCLITSTKPIKMHVKDVTILLFAVSAFAIVGSILLSFVLSSRLLIPIKKLDTALEQVELGNYDVELEEEGEDELAHLNMAFNSMVKSLKEREKPEIDTTDSDSNSTSESDSEVEKENSEPPVQEENNIISDLESEKKDKIDTSDKA